MLMDKYTIFSDGVAITATASSETIDFGAFRDMGTGAMDIEVYCGVTELFTSGGATTLTITLETDDNSAFSSAATLYTTAAIAKAALVVGYEPFPGLKLPANVERYLRLTYTVATGPFTAGKVTSGLVLASQRFRAYQNIVL